jgi:hypothetical protein
MTHVLTAPTVVTEHQPAESCACHSEIASTADQTPAEMPDRACDCDQDRALNGLLPSRSRS